MMSEQQDLLALLSLKKQVKELSIEELVTRVKSWGDLSKKNNISCYDQARCDISLSSHLKNINIGQNSNLFKSDCDGICEYYISMLKNNT